LVVDTTHYNVTEDEFDVAVGLSYIGLVDIDNLDTYVSVNFEKNHVTYKKNPQPGEEIY
jgi:hypothetical protein